VGLRAFAERRYGSLSEGERKRVLLARALMTDPELLLLDEPAAGLDLGAREALLRLLTRLTGVGAPPTALVTHHVEEIPVGTTHALLLSRGRVLASGPIEQVLTGPLLTQAFGIPLQVSAADGRWTARATGP
jgi:iron complex transport system ATP-binding protein